MLKLLTSTLYTDESPYTEQDAESLVQLFREEFCRRNGWPKEDPLEVVVDLGSRGGALHAVEKARRVMGEHLGDVRKWDELPVSNSADLLAQCSGAFVLQVPWNKLIPMVQMEIPLPASRRYHSVFVCPVSKEQATESNPPKMLTCGHVIASESLNKMLKAG